MTTYRIRNWNDHFENNRTRVLDNMTWIPVPNKHDGEGFLTIMGQPDGLKIYGAWHLILQVASKCRTRGTLVRDDGTPHTPESIALKTGRIKAKDILRALEFCSTEIDWVEPVHDVEKPQQNATSGTQVPDDGTQVPVKRQRMEGKGREEKDSKREALSGFEDFWEAYPNKTGKKAALKAWNAAADKPPIGQILQALELQKKTTQWQKEAGRYIPNPTTWINQGRWDDRPTSTAPKATPPPARQKTYDEYVTDACLELDAVKTESREWVKITQNWTSRTGLPTQDGVRVIDTALDIIIRRRAAAKATA